jgi:hypothetical protein
VTARQRPGWLACQNPTHRPGWVVRVRRGNYSAFNGYRFTPSAYSLVRCPACPATWRTKAAYVTHLPDEEVRLA